jgi:hypothetical protein
MLSTTEIIERNTLEIVNRIANKKNIKSFVSAKVTGYSSVSESIYVDAEDVNGDYIEIRLSDHKDCHYVSSRLCVDFSELEKWGIIKEDSNWESKFDNEYEYEIWSNEEKSYNDQAFIYIK